MTQNHIDKIVKAFTKPNIYIKYCGQTIVSIHHKDLFLNSYTFVDELGYEALFIEHEVSNFKIFEIKEIDINTIK